MVSCQNERSQIQNKASAMMVLQAKLLERRRQEQQAEMDALKDGSSSWGNQMRSYVLHPYQMVKDLRTNHEVNNPHRRARRRHRRVHRGRHPLAPEPVTPTPHDRHVGCESVMADALTPHVAIMNRIAVSGDGACG